MHDEKTDILKKITDLRKKNIEEKGFSLGVKILENRERPLTPFLPKKGTILEVKRASPSKGDIAPNLDAPKTALEYVNAGTAAISVLTEENFFKGSLKDLMEVSRAVGTKAAVLRKDFLLYEEEIDVSYRAGADAILLIARILDGEQIVSMAKKAFSFGLGVLLEVREESDIEKAMKVISEYEKTEKRSSLVLGINSRDLSTFAIDLLIPLKLKERIKFSLSQKKITSSVPPVISESGIMSPETAELTGSLGFDGVLIGEAAARSPENAEKLVSSFLRGTEKTSQAEKNCSSPVSFWQKTAFFSETKRISHGGKTIPLVKVCGLTDLKDALFAAELGADFLGFIFCKKSPRNVSENFSFIKKVKESLTKSMSENSVNSGNGKIPLFIGVVTEDDSDEFRAALALKNEGVLDALQFHNFSCRSEFKNLGYSAVSVSEKNDIQKIKSEAEKGAVRILIDSKSGSLIGGTGIKIPSEIINEVKKITPLWLAGGIDTQNVRQIIDEFTPELIDICSGVETSPGKKDNEKMKRLFREILDF